MALIKKFHPGGPIDRRSLNQALDRKIASLKFRNSDEEKQVREAVAALRDHILGGGIFDADEVTKTFRTGAVSNSDTQGTNSPFKGSDDLVRKN